MNNNEPKVPNPDFGWDAIDIFLFSNGQEYSPPRKYHLRANDLDWWDATLNHLAKLHFGTLHSVIELYTIHGDKVEGPLELSDGSPYVAVVPPDTFMDTGYEKYLLKASRSWEKRKAKKASLEAAVKHAATKEETSTRSALETVGHPENLAVSWSKAEPEIYQTESPKQWSSQVTDETSVVSELTTIKMPDEMHLAVSSVMKPQKNISDASSKKIVISTPPSNGRNGKKHTPGQQHTSFVKTGPVNTSPWKNNTKKRDFQKKMLTKIPIKIERPLAGMTVKPTYVRKYPHESTPLPPTSLLPPTSQTPKLFPPKTSGTEVPPPERTVSLLAPPTPTPTTAGIEQPSTPFFLPPAPPPPPQCTLAHATEIISPGLASSFASNLPSIPATPTKCHTMLTLHNKALLTDKSLVADKGLTTDAASMQNVIGDKELLIITTDGCVYKQVENNLIVVNEEKDTTISVEEETQTHIDVTTCEVNTMISKHMAYTDSVKVIPAAVVSQSNILNCDLPLGDNCIAVINKGDAINLNLNIELPNEESLHTNNPSAVSFHNSHVRKVSSLTNILKTKRSQTPKEETEIPTKSLDSLIYNINECYANVVVVQCACCGNNTTIPRMDAMPVYKDNNGFFILMPSPGQQENSNCMCCPAQQKRPDKKGISALCLELCKPHSSTVFPCVQQDMGMTTTVADSMGSQTDKYLKTICNMCVLDQGPMCNRMGLNSDRCERCNSSTSDSQFLEKLEIFVSETNITKSLPVSNCNQMCNCMDAYAQTDWCGVLLQAKRHEDGRYSFHLPPLNVLKCYALV